MSELPRFPFHIVEVPGADALQAWQHYQALWRKEGCSAILLGGDVEDVTANHAFHANARENLDLAARITAAKFFADRAEEEEYDAGEGEWPAAKEGEPALVRPHELCIHLNLGTRKPLPKVFIAQIPTEKPYEIPAYLGWGGWNACPGPAEHVAILRHWHAKYGIEIYGITSDVLECAVAQPPLSRDECLALAREQYLYCADIVDQGVQTLSALAATLQNSHAWFFWWD
ncbi:MAG TPA: DUF4253 domain-containing protein [Chthoniobacteraceae bacterium]|nr:DUF4253 domain-containing protein [Chthoniobacteraceae bacterium]